MAEQNKADKKIWQKTKTKMHPAVNKYIINIKNENTLLPYDVEASMAHAKMLASVGLITNEESISLVKALEEVRELHRNDEFHLHTANEDCHTAIESFLTKQTGDAGKKIHMGRSRNDQMMVAMRLLCRDRVHEIQEAMISLIETLQSFAKQHEFVPMPGYTHYQQAMPSSVGQWMGNFVESLLDDWKLLSAAYEYTNQNPLGAAAAFGTNLPVDRDFTTKELEFSKPMINCLYTQNSRGKIESFIASTMVQVMLTLGKIANDMVLFTTKEFPFFAVDDSLTTGSSIMPQKKNLDIMEVLRANVSSVIAAQLEMQTVHQNLMSGYNKDLKITKPAVMKCFELTLGSIEITNILFQFTTPKEDNLRNAFMPEIFATDVVNNMVKDGATFREAYVAVGDDLDAVRSMDLDENLKSKTHLGAPGNLGLDRYNTMLDALKADLAAKPKRIESRWS